MTRLPSRLLLLLALTLIISCDSNDTTIDDIMRLSDAQKRWEANALDTYTIDQNILCFCGGPRSFTIDVEADSIANVFITGPELILWEISEEELKEWVYTVDDLFVLIAENIDSAHRVDVEYHPRYGFPTELYIDREENVIDEEVTIQVTDLRVTGL